MKRIISMFLSAMLVFVSAVGFFGCSRRIIEERADIAVLPGGGWTMAMSVYPGVPISLDYGGDADTVWSAASDVGSVFLNAGDVDTVLTLSDGETFYWQPDMDDYIDAGASPGARYTPDNYQEYSDYVSLIARTDGNITGYAVVRCFIERRESDVVKSGEVFIYNAEIVESAIFPPVDGEYQKVSEEYANERLEAAKGN